MGTGWDPWNYCYRLRKKPEDACLVGSNPAKEMDVRLLCLLCCIGSGLFDGLTTRSEEYYHVCVCVCVCVI